MDNLTREEERVWHCPDCGCEHVVPATLDQAETVGELLAYLEAAGDGQAPDDDFIPF